MPMSPQLPDAEQLVAQLAEAMRAQVTPDTGMVGIYTGGVWLAERLHAALGLTQPLGAIDVSFYRDDVGAGSGGKALHKNVQRSSLPFDVDGRPVIIVDDVLYTGRTIRAAMNELFDYGRPSRIDLAVLVDRGGRELPVEARWCGATLTVGDHQNVQLERNDRGALSLRIIDAA